MQEAEESRYFGLDAETCKHVYLNFTDQKPPYKSDKIQKKGSGLIIPSASRGQGECLSLEGGFCLH